MTKEVILLALGPSREQCLFDCPEVWGVNNTYKYAYSKPNGFLTKLFIAHTQVYKPENMGARAVFDWEEINRLSKEKGIQVISTHKINMLDSIRYPLPQIVEKFGSNYFTNTNCYMIAYSLLKGYDKLRLYGIDMAVDEPFYSVEERNGVEFWLGLAKARGVKIDIARMERSVLLGGVN